MTEKQNKTQNKTVGKKAPNYRSSGQYEEEYSKELINFKIKYSPVYLKDYQKYYESMDQYINKGETKEFRHFIQTPINSSFKSAAEAAIKTVDQENELPRRGTNTIVAMTMNIFVANQIYSIAKKEKQSENLETCIVSAINERLPLFKIFGAYANRAKNLIVISAIPYMYAPKKNKGKIEQETENIGEEGVPKRINYSRFIVNSLKLKLPQFIFTKIKELDFFKIIKQEEQKRDTTAWKMERIAKVAKDDSISLQALGIYVKLILSEHQDMTKLQEELGKKRSGTFRNARVELQSKGHVLMIRPKRRGDRWITKII
ncbi:hypothetical protein [Liquorilactobacillus hordei]|uniref:hypothetical protein n=1 Tax=Liquorilactobacillus hordei TaxID=468911 RepID=UPI001CC12437|nr:hypothetical protein [Liquorilactobacillus hordei]MBZ2406660.1 hypothetical protein [Liquorilactobacillus hordei]